MSTNIVIPEVGESVTHGVIAAWRKNVGDFVNRDETVLDLETDKITAEIPAPASGVLKEVRAQVGEQVAIRSVVGVIDESAAAPAQPARPANSSPAREKKADPGGGQPADRSRTGGPLLPARVGEHAGTTEAAEQRGLVPRAPSIIHDNDPERPSRRVKMTPLRARIAERLVEAKQTTAMLTTFNEADMSAVIALRKKYKESFEKAYGTGLGFMPFFVKAAVSALKAVPAVNASIVVGDSGAPEVEYHDFYDIAIAVSTPKGLTVPVLRGCDKLSISEIELGIADLAERARTGELSLADLQGGTYTISNGGVFGSLMSTPILNSPQTGILGMHAIKTRPIEHPPGSGQMALRPMMYLAMSYDHRLIDGAESVTFLLHVKNCIEDPTRLVLSL